MTKPTKPRITARMTTKYCKKCDQTLGAEAFHKSLKEADGLAYKCKACKKKYNEANKARISAYRKEYYEAHKDKAVAYAREYYEANQEQIVTQKKEYARANPDKRNALEAKRRATKLQATPEWLTKRDFALIESYYIKAKLLELETQVKHHVDHIIPLTHPQVCGLHVPANLQVITAEENLVKGNTFVVE